jgi:hypothetical protein
VSARNRYHHGTLGHDSKTVKITQFTRFVLSIELCRDLNHPAAAGFGGPCGKILFSTKKIKPTRVSLPIHEAAEIFNKSGMTFMHRTHLRIYNGPADQSATLNLAESKDQRQTVTLPLGEVLPHLADAVQSERTWLRDFENDEITISTDLYEVILAYQHYRRPSA